MQICPHSHSTLSDLDSLNQTTLHSRQHNSAAADGSFWYAHD